MRIWIDITDLEAWSGHLTGTQRVAYNIARRYADSEYDVAYFAFDERRKVFLDMDFEPLRSRVEAAQIESAEAAQNGPAPTLKQRVKRLPRRMIHYIPIKVRERVPPTAKRGVKKLYRVSVHVAKQAYHAVPRRKALAQNIPQAVFRQGDVVLVLGKPWDFPTLMPALGVLQQETKFRLITFVHDMMPTLQPHLFGPGLFEPYTKTMFDAMELSQGLLVASQSTKKDIERFCKLLHIAVPPIVVARLGDDIIEDALSDSAVSFSDPRITRQQYLLDVGTVEVRKNITLMYAVYCEAALRGVDLPPLVVVGRPGWLTGDVLYQITHDPKVKDKFVLMQGLNDQQLRWLYQHCRFSIFPSAYEGWGLPVAESLGYGKLCLTTNVASMPEIAGDLIEYFSPYDAGQCLALMQKYLDDKVLSAAEKEIAARYHRHDWDATYRAFDAFVQKTAKENI